MGANDSAFLTPRRSYVISSGLIGGRLASLRNPSGRTPGFAGDARFGRWLSRKRCGGLAQAASRMSVGRLIPRRARV
jgi:hypothetical protein